jgi:hypothetical protein
MADRRKCVVFVLAYNEEENIRGVLESLKALPAGYDIVVINNASADKTPVLARQLGATVLDLPYNVDIGGGRQAGYKYALDKGYDIAVQMDGDGQHDPASVPALVSAVEEAQADLAIGSRFLKRDGDQSTAARRAGITFLSGLLGLLLGKPVLDPTSGFRACNRKVIELFCHSYPLDFPEPESLLLLSRHGYSFTEVSVRMAPRLHGQSSVTFLKSFYYMAKITLALLIGTLRKT